MRVAFHCQMLGDLGHGRQALWKKGKRGHQSNGGGGGGSDYSLPRPCGVDLCEGKPTCSTRVQQEKRVKPSFRGIKTQPVGILGGGEEKSFTGRGVFKDASPTIPSLFGRALV